MHNATSSPTSAAAATMHKIVLSFDSAAISSPTSPSMPSAFGDHHFRPLAFPAVDAQGSMLSALYAAAMTPFLTTSSDGSPLSTGATGTSGYGDVTTTLAMSPLALESVIASKKLTTKKTASRSLWKCRRRRLSMKDLLSSPTPPSHQRVHSSKASARRQCGIPECTKYALSGGFCISHGGGKLCRQEYCQTVAQSGGLCKAHGGGSKCKAPACGSVARRQGLCMAHGGRQACKIDGCNKCAHGGGLCIAHGGGKRCSFDDCPKSAQAGGLCYSHGGGKRCAAPECFQAARKGGRCIRHRDDAVRV